MKAITNTVLMEGAQIVSQAHQSGECRCESCKSIAELFGTRSEGQGFLKHIAREALNRVPDFLPDDAKETVMQAQGGAEITGTDLTSAMFKSYGFAMMKLCIMIEAALSRKLERIRSNTAEAITSMKDGDGSGVLELLERIQHELQAAELPSAGYGADEIDLNQILSQLRGKYRSEA